MLCDRDKKRLSCVICKAVCTLTLHHMGSVAFGSLIITLIKIPRYILMYIQKKYAFSFIEKKLLSFYNESGPHTVSMCIPPQC